MPEPLRLVRIPTLKTVETFRTHVASLGIELPCEDSIIAGPASPLAKSIETVTINGKKILIRGGGWSPDMMLREDPQRLRDEFRYVQDMGLNTIRLEGKLENEEFLELADRSGILLMAGWCCCDHWEHWANWKPQDFKIAEQSIRDQIYRLRGHPSLVMWLNGSDNPPPPDVELTYINVEKELLWPNPVVSSATAKLAGSSGESGVKMTGPYEYVAPGYWEQDRITKDSPHQCNAGGCGGAFGFNTETSMGPAVPPIESIRQMLPKEHLWPIDDWWNYHAGGGAFKDIHVFTDALNARFGQASSVEDYALKAQLQTYEGVRAMYEAHIVKHLRGRHPTGRAGRVDVRFAEIIEIERWYVRPRRIRLALGE